MPIYVYGCNACGAVEEHIQRFSDAPLTECSSCGGRLEKQVTAAAFQLKGGGWYKDGYASAKADKPSDSAASGSESSGSGSSDSASKGSGSDSGSKGSGSGGSDSSSKGSDSGSKGSGSSGSGSDSKGSGSKKPKGSGSKKPKGSKGSGGTSSAAE
jgi:putative FmdB family regulatory protein